MKNKKKRSRNILSGALTLSIVGACLLTTRADSVPAPAKRANFTVEQRIERLREHQAILHPRWKDLSWSARAARAWTFTKRLVQPQDATVAPTPANFKGNFTFINGTPGNLTLMALQRQTDCSLSLISGTYSYSLSPVQISYQLTGTTANYQNTLHTAAGLTTTAGVFAGGCADPTLGIGSRRAFYLGRTNENLLFMAASGYDMGANSGALFTQVIDPATGAAKNFAADHAQPNIAGLAAGDLNGDGLSDVVGIDDIAGSVTVWLANKDGTLGTGTAYPLSGTATEAAVLADVNGDGKTDLIVATRDAANAETVFVLTGKGDGRFNAGQPLAVPTPPAPGIGASSTLHNLIAADLRASGHLDLVGSNGLVLLNAGDGSFTVGTAAFAAGSSASIYGPNLASGDFNKDGKIDLAVDNGVTVDLYLGRGDGTFTRGLSYAAIDDVGYLTATDLDGDGNLDIYVGLGNGGFLGGDQYGANQGYALMGNGDGSFQGAPALPFVYTGNNLGDLNKDGLIDGVGVTGTTSLTAYLGDGKGGFSVRGTVATPAAVFNGVQYPASRIDSFTLADVNGDGVPDLLWVAPIPNQSPGVLIALGDGAGGFAAPVMYTVPSFLTSGDIDIDPAIYNLRVADVNHDGKLDLIYAYADTSYATHAFTVGTAVQLGNGDGTFQAQQTIPFYSGTSGYVPTSRVAQIADLNKDGNPDLIFITESSTIDHTLSAYAASIQVALGHGDGTFGTPTTVAGPDVMRQIVSSTQYAPLAVADMNGDGVPDLIALGASSSYDLQVTVSLGNGDGTFRAPISNVYAAQALNSEGLAVADFNGDGKLDVAVTDPYIAGASGISLGNGDGTLQPLGSPGSLKPNLGIGLQVGGPTLTLDFNGDGKPDLISGGVVLLAQAAPTQGGGGTGSGGGAVPADFALTASALTGSVAAGQSTATTLSVTPTNGFNQSIALSCAGLPAGASCAFAPATVAMDGTTAAVSTLTIATTGAVAMASRGPLNHWLPDGIVLAGLAMPVWVRRRRRGAPRAGTILHGWAIALAATALLHGCGGDRSITPANGSSGTPVTPAGTYTVTITATGTAAANAAAVTHSVAYVLTVT